jgi:penicillin-binding protein 2
MSRFRVDLRLMVVALVVLLSMGAVAAKLWWVQVARGEEYTKRIRSNSYATVRIPSIRGEIRDRNGIQL